MSRFNDDPNNMSGNLIHATMASLGKGGFTIPDCKVIRNNPEAVAAMYAALQPFLRPVNLHPERHYDLSAVLGLAEPLTSIVWPQVELAENQFLAAYRGESPAQVLPGATTKEVYIWEKLPTFPWWKKGQKSGIYLITLPLPDSGGMVKAKKAKLCQKNGGEMAPFVLNAMVRLAHKALTDEVVGGWNICPELTNSGYSAWLNWGGARLRCDGDWVDSTNDYLLASSSERLSGLEF